MHVNIHMLVWHTEMFNLWLSCRPMCNPCPPWLRWWEEMTRWTLLCGCGLTGGLWCLSAQDQGPKNTSECSPAPCFRCNLRILLGLNANILGQLMFTHQWSGATEPGAKEKEKPSLNLCSPISCSSCSTLLSQPFGGGLTNLRFP